METAEEIEGREDEEPEGHALGVVGGVVVWEERAERAEPVFAVLLSEESRWL